MFQINFKPIRGLNIILIIFVAIFFKPVWAINVRCAVAILDTELRDIDANQFNKAFGVAIRGENQEAHSSRLPYGFMKLLSSGRFNEVELNRQLEEFYSTYRNNSHYLEEFKTLTEQKNEPWITRYHSHYLWLVTEFLMPRVIKANSSPAQSGAILQEMALVNKTILEDLNISNLRSTPIVAISDAIKKSVELRTAVYIELKLSNQSLSRDAILSGFRKLIDANIQGQDWSFLNQVVLRSRGQTNYMKALKILKEIRKNIETEKSLQGYELAFYDIMITQKLTAQKTLQIYRKFFDEWNASSIKNTLQLNLESHLLLDFLRVGPEKLTAQALIRAFEKADQFRDQLNTQFMPERYRDSRTLLVLIYFAQLRRSGYPPESTNANAMTAANHTAIWQSSIAIYNQVFAQSAEVNWLREELFLGYILN